MQKKAAWIVIFCLSFIVIFSLAIMDMENQISITYKGLMSNVEKQRDSVQARLDSVNEENFRIDIELNRYKIAYEILTTRNPKGALDYYKILMEETE
jgi:hypothetical protein